MLDLASCGCAGGCTPTRRTAGCTDPHLPHWLTDLTLRGLRVGQAIVALGFWREAGTSEGERTRWEMLDQQGDLTIEEQPWLPWHVEELAARMA